jgi:hypothetical protein
MRRLLAAALAAPLALAVATPASAEPVPPPPLPPMCDGEVLTIEFVRDTSRFHPREFGFSVTGNGIVRLSDGDSSVDVRVPGRLSITDDPEAGTLTFVLSGRNLLFAETPAQREALEAAGLPEIALITGRVVIVSTFDPEEETVSEEIVSFTPHVVDVCALLDR